MRLFFFENFELQGIFLLWVTLACVLKKIAVAVVVSDDFLQDSEIPVREGEISMDRT